MVLEQVPLHDFKVYLKTRKVIGEGIKSPREELNHPSIA